MQTWTLACGVAGVALAFGASARHAGPAFAGLAAVLALIVFNMRTQAGGGEPWLAYALLLVAPMCIVVSGMLDEVRPRVVAGWLGVAAAIAAITWAVKGSLLRRAVFLAIAGLSAIGLSFALSKWVPHRSPQ